MEIYIKLVTLVVFSTFIGASVGIMVYISNNPITPMDVYQGKTTLEYKVVDGVKVDSCVVFKK